MGRLRNSPIMAIATIWAEARIDYGVKTTILTNAVARMIFANINAND